MYKIIFSPGFQKDLSKIPKDYHKKINETILTLSKNPYPKGCVKLSSEEAYRIRIGIYRIIYRIFKNELILEILKVGHRQGVY